MDEATASQIAAALEHPDFPVDNARIGPQLIGWLIHQLGDRLRVDIVQTVADLPASAGPRQWFRVVTGTAEERTSVYVGNGSGQPLRKIPTLPL